MKTRPGPTAERKTIMEQTPEPTFPEGTDGNIDERYRKKGVERGNGEMSEVVNLPVPDSGVAENDPVCGVMESIQQV
ncbi:hypothetical protein PPTG_24810 [Phytophthora nicotianae INRA-310]|uniref:Uncharacterized protein n=1 Tax=Phytophthora nicotianae (strain INRA-310) TaxID=761204 RepID=W2PCX1_PHYN3|nr:hypothetical protein PPTG_24810 [Phytophthora nicotianae INRA-310]ETM97844.1 hypothetical protein PPTG_24810 [Phytophthora nicotianae INRA-310]